MDTRDRLDPSTTQEHRDPAASDSVASDPRVIEAAKQFLAMLEQGTAPTTESFCARYPDIAESLAPCIAGLAFLNQGLPLGRPDAAVPLQDGDSSNEVPSALGDFRILKEIGRGGMGVVYEAVQLSLGRRVALKVLSFAGALDSIRLQRFRNEAQAAAQLHHTHIVPVYAVGSDRGVHYYAMQLIEGQSLAQVIDALKQSRQSTAAPQDQQTYRRLSTPRFAEKDIATSINPIEADSTKYSGKDTHSSVSANKRASKSQYFKSLASMVLQASKGLAHAHQYGVVHRDVKPANIMLDPIGNIWITDFGLAQVQNDARLTRTGDMLGTLRYMSPEQASGGDTPVDHRTDIYSLGLTLYELLTLCPAVSGSGYHDITNQIANADPPLPRTIDSSIPAELELIAMKALSKSPIERYSTATEFGDDLRRWLEDKPIYAKAPTFLQRFSKWRRRHSGLVAVASGFSILAAIGLLITTFMIAQEQRKTSSALARERGQRQAAEVSFQQAKRAVETFTQIGETELANRPDLKSLRREFLEASLEFYRDFIELRGNEPTLHEELTATKIQVQQLVDSLKRLDQTAPLKMLMMEAIQKELEIPSELAQTIVKRLEDLEEKEDSVEAEEPLSDIAFNIVQQYEWIREQLNESQQKRLAEIHRQSRLPFTFKSTEVVDALELSMEQRKKIGMIIEQERPDRAARKLAGPDAPKGPRNPPPDIPGAPIGRRKPPPRGGPPRDRDDRLLESQTQKTVDRILEILTPIQLQKWESLIGKPFAPGFRDG